MCEQTGGVYLCGPHRKSEFKSKSTMNNFIASYIFYFSYEATHLLIDAYDELSQFKKNNADLVNILESFKKIFCK